MASALRIVLSGIAAGLLGGCAGTPQTRGTHAPAGPLSLSLTIEASSPGAASHAVSEGEALSPRDRVALHVAVDRPSYIYAVQSAEDGAQDVFYPPGPRESAPLPGGAALRIPPTGQWLAASGDARAETLFVLASPRPLDLSAPGSGLCRHLPVARCHTTAAPPPGNMDIATRGVKDPPPPPPPPPGNMTVATRGLAGPGLRARAGGAGVAVLRVVLRYAQAPSAQLLPSRGADPLF